jgi:hypothetical protein
MPLIFHPIEPMSERAAATISATPQQTGAVANEHLGCGLSPASLVPGAGYRLGSSDDRGDCLLQRR